MQTDARMLLARPAHAAQLREALDEKGYVYLGAYFGSGKTVLIHQMLAQTKQTNAYFCCADANFDPELPNIPAGTSLVIVENLEALTAPEKRAALHRRLQNLPEQTKVLLTGRSSLPSWLKTDYAMGRMTLLGQRFMAFTPEESMRYIRQRGLQPTQGMMTFVQQTNYGWAMAMSLGMSRIAASGQPPEKVLEQIWRDVFDCFDHVLFDTYDAEIQSFLLHMGGFVAFTPAMAAAVTGKDTASATLLRLLDLGSYMIPDGAGGYTVQEFMHNYLLDLQRRRCSREFIAEQFNRAGDFWAAQGELLKALDAYRMSENWDAMVRLMLDDARHKAASGHYADLRPYYELLPQETVRAHPQLMSALCMSYSLRCQVEESERWFQALQDYAGDKSHPDTDLARDELFYLRMTLPHRGSRQVAGLFVEGAKRLLCGELYTRSMSVAGNGPSLLNGGKDFCVWVPHAQNLYRYLRKPVETVLGESGAGLGNIALGETLYETALNEDFSQAISLLTAGIAEADARGDWEIRYAGVGVLARVFAAQGEMPRAQELLQGFQRQLGDEPLKRLRSNLRAQEVRMGLRRGDIGMAQQWFRAEAPDEAAGFSILDRYAYMTKLRIDLAENKAAEFNYLANRMLTYYRTYERPYGQAECLLLMAIFHYRRRESGWKARLQEALALGETYCLVRLVADEGVAVTPLLEHLPKQKRYNEVIQAAACTQARLYPAYLAPQQPEKQELTETERAVFRLLAAGKKNEEIATVLNITVRTVKFHTGNLYRKLNVTGRADAIRRAAELGLK